MNEEGDTPSGSQTAGQDKKKVSIPTKVLHKIGLERRSVVENELKMKSKENELLKKSESDLKSRTSQLENEVELMTIDKKVSDATVTDKDNEIKLNAEEIECLKSRISELKNEVQSAKDNSKNAEIMIRAKFTDVSKLTEEEVYSQPTEHAGITWRMSVDKDDLNCIWFYLVGEKESAVEWFCPVFTEFLMFSQKSREIIHRSERKLIFDASNSILFLNSISHEDLFNDEKGFVKDDSVIVAVALRAFPRSIHQTLEMTIDAKFTDISKLTKEKVYSQPTEFAGVTWMINVDNIGSYVYFYLDGKKENAVGWWCAVITEFRLISQKSKEIVHRREKKLIYDAKESSQYFEMISHKDLFNVENGFVKDDSIIVAVSLRVIPTN